jgi:hypothetical protein
MFVVIPTGRTYTSTVESEYERSCVCEKCATEFTYRFTVAGSGQGSSALFLRNKGAAEDAQKNAIANLQKNAKAAFPPVACPNCNHIQTQMLQYYRRHRFVRVNNLALVALLLIVSISTIMMFVVGSFSMLASPIYWGFVGTPAAVIGLVHLARRYSHPRLPKTAPMTTA